MRSAFAASPINNTTCVLGIDTGNTKTLALVAALDGTIVGWARRGCGDIYGTETSEALRAIQEAGHEALHLAGIGAHRLGGTVLCAAGADWPEDFSLIAGAAKRDGLGNCPIVYNDALGGLRAGSPDGTGVVVACGTGAAVGARAGDGRIWHGSFWQGVHGAGQLAEKTLSAVYRAELGIDPPTALTAAVLRHFDVDSVERVLHLLTALARTHLNIRPLARVLLDVANGGDAVARDIVATHGEGLGDYALAAARKVDIVNSAFHLVLTGGVMRHQSPLLRNAIIDRVHTYAPSAQPCQSSLEPVFGAVMLAMDTAKIEVTATTRARLLATAPPLSFFET